MDSLNCPITCVLFRDPVMGSDGHTYERESIILWLQQHGTSPITREPMAIDSLRPNHSVRKMVEEFAVISQKKDYQFILDVDVRRTETRPWFQAFGKSIYKAAWVQKQGPPIVLMKIEGAKASREASFYVKLSYHPYIVRTYGFVKSDPHCVMLVQEYAEKGDLGELLRENDFKPNRRVLMEIFTQIIDAMICLADNGIIHGDLACRNVLVFRFDANDPEKNLVKLTDFGLTKASDLFSVAASTSQTTMTIIPVRYCGPEVLRTGGERTSYSEKSDVYSMGVLMWEACSYGTLPFSSITDDSEVKRRKLRGDQLPKPAVCDDDLWSAILKCWNMEPDERPSFKELRRQMIRSVHALDSTLENEDFMVGSAGQAKDNNESLVLFVSPARVQKSTGSVSSNIFIQRPLIKWSLVFLFGLIILTAIFHMLQKQYNIMDKFNSNLNIITTNLKIKTEYLSSNIINFQSYSVSLLNIFIFLIRFNWIAFYIVIHEFLLSHNYLLSYTGYYQFVKRKVQNWYRNSNLRYGIISSFILSGPLLLEVFLLYSTRIFYPLLAPFLFIIQYNWLILIFIIDGIIIKQKYFPNFTRKYQEIKTDIDNYLLYNLDTRYTEIRRRLSYWHTNNNFENRITLFAILIAPLIIQTLFLYTIPISKLFLSILWKLLIFIIRYGWLILIILITESVFIEHQHFPKYIKLYNTIKESLIHWRMDNKFRSVVILISIVTGPFILEMCFIWFIPMIKLVFSLLWKLCQLLIIYCWPILIIIISEILKENQIFSSYTEKYESISRKIKNWIGQSKLKFMIVIIPILIIPALLEHCKIRSISIREISLFLFVKLFLFIIHYCWLILIIVISAILKKYKIIPSYTEIFDSFMRKIDCWTGQSDLKFGIVSILVLGFPALCEHCKIGSLSIRELFLFFLMKSFLIIIRYCWLALIIIISAILKNLDMFPNYIEKCTLLAEKLEHWAKNSTLRGIAIFAFILLTPFTLEMAFIWFLPLIKLLFYLLWKLFSFLIHYFWCVLLILICEILEESDICSNYMGKYKTMKQRIVDWQKQDQFKIMLTIFSIVFGPFLLEMFLFYGLKSTVTLIMFLVKKTFFYLTSIFVFYCLSRWIHH
ncbi:unnamed protein product [Rotaria sp. Silwood2]|nr:unnamed protein product [Rotaria sp. Silwood2]CAF3428500.1 unnamed protein product [Rotaria sp. Silwood2]CAF4474897.1 unnamed protein product [Rotaria sp. Silwood2]CAF4520632.1 unnamed protein product [Rotaria sp. Silwood2]